jgi:hypothetical protein
MYMFFHDFIKYYKSIYNLRKNFVKISKILNYWISIINPEFQFWKNFYQKKSVFFFVVNGKVPGNTFVAQTAPREV